MTAIFAPEAIHLEPATLDDAATLAALHTATASDLTQRFGPGPWSMKTAERGVLYGMRTSRVYVAWVNGEIVATLRLTTKKPWAIDSRYFRPCERPLYLMSMAVAVDRQRQGIGRRCLEEAARIAREWPADAIRLNAYEAKAGAGPFYARCGWADCGRAMYRRVRLRYYELRLKQVRQVA